MRQFFAMLKDSYREAVDGFVIYVMLALAAIVILIVGSMSFTPAAPEKAFSEIVEHFSLVFPEKGRSRVFTQGSNTTYKALEVQRTDDGYSLRLTALGRTNATITNDKGETRPDLTSGDSFRQTVFSWAAEAGESREFEKDGKKVEVGMMRVGTAEDQRKVTTEQMEEFIASQFAVHAGMKAEVKRVPGVDEPKYEFEVKTSGGSSVRGWPHTVKIFFGAVTIAEDEAPLGIVLWIIEDQVINGLGGGIALLISVIITAFFIPNMLRKGSIDLLVSKPIGRSQLLVYKYIGGLTFIFLVSSFAIGGVWLVLAARSGYWDPSFLVVIPLLTIAFAILYAVSTLGAVVTRSPIVAMLMAIGAGVFLWFVGKAKQWADTRRDNRGDTPDWVFTVIDSFNNFLPRYKDLDTLSSKLIASGTLTPAEERMFGLALLEYPSWSGVLGVTFIFIAIMLAISCFWFSRRDY